MQNKTNSVNVAAESALLVKVILPGDPMEPAYSIAELESLVKAAGAEVLGYICQKRRSVSPAMYVGRGKALQIAERAQLYGANIVVFDNNLSPAQIRELEKIIPCKILDRSELILDIFATRARTAEARLQVELAQLEYTYPRLTRMWTHLDTVVGGAGGGAVAAVGGIGTRGPGESQLEIDRRLVQKRIAALHRKINEIDRRKNRQVRSRHNYFTVSLVGYTNAGKTTLMNTLTGSDQFVADQLFATLDTKTARWNLSHEIGALLSDTVGFVRDLPHNLVASFRATLEETIHADLLLHVVDISHPQAQAQIDAVNQVLAEMNLQKKDVILLFNKTDCQDAASRRDTFCTLYPDAIPISAKTGIGIDRLLETVLRRVTGEHLTLRVTCPQSDGRIPNFLRAHGTVLSESYQDSTTILEAKLGRRQLPALQKLHPQNYEILPITT